jgi:rare lipoprotein A (peptidoglycan hydrolase)
MHAIRVSQSKSHARSAIVGLVLAAAAFAVLLFVAPAAEAAKARASYAPHIDRHLVPTRGATNLGAQLATWYGPGFFGNRTACGQRLTTQTWGIAHRTLPCGTLVSLSLKGRRVTVPVIDRGPYSGATIDLTSRTKSFLRFTSGRVPMVRVAKYRLLPVPKPVSGVVKAGSTRRG